MKILAVGDFHGTFLKKFVDLIRKEKIDLVVSNGDYFPFLYRKLWFKYSYHKDTNLWDVMGRKKYEALVKNDLDAGDRTLKKLNALHVPVITVTGNLDYTDLKDAYDKRPVKGDLRRKDFFTPMIKKYHNISRFEYKALEIWNFVFIGAYGGSFPGNVKSKNYKSQKKKLDKLFSGYKGRNIIFVSHNVPYNTKLDKISMKAHKDVRGKHYGSKQIRRLIDRWQPILHVGGHIHEGKGLCNLRKTLCVNPGAVHEGHGAVITLYSGKKPKVKFIS